MKVEFSIQNRRLVWVWRLVHSIWAKTYIWFL